MDSFEWNKVFGAFLAVAFVALGVTFLSDGLYHADDPETAGFEIEGGPVETEVAGPAPTAEPVMPMLASMSPADGEGVARKCVACHNFEKGSANKVGPQLWDIVNRDIAGVEGFGYSGALKEYGEGKQWTYEELNGFLWKPKAHVKGTSMGFAGIKKVEERAELIAYLRTLSDSPAEMPSADAVATPAAGDGDNVEPADPNTAPTPEAGQPVSPGATGTIEGVVPDQPLGGAAEEAPAPSTGN